MLTFVGMTKFHTNKAILYITVCEMHTFVINILVLFVSCVVVTHQKTIYLICKLHFSVTLTVVKCAKKYSSMFNFLISLYCIGLLVFHFWSINNLKMYDQ